MVLATIVNLLESIEKDKQPLSQTDASPTCMTLEHTVARMVADHNELVRLLATTAAQPRLGYALLDIIAKDNPALAAILLARMPSSMSRNSARIDAFAAEVARVEPEVRRVQRENFNYEQELESMRVFGVDTWCHTDRRGG